jgi:3-hydroxyacyl-CoA dehydrogenase/enoyl-CoA hydratase/carnithine racemase
VSAEAVEFPGELVTHARLRRVALPGGPTFGLITLDNGADHSRPTTFGPGGLRSLDDALSAAEAADVDAVAVTGKPFFFAVGADLTGVPQIRSREQALAIGRLGHRVFGRLGTSRTPTFAFVNGAALGGGLELALHCRYRTISAAVPAVGLPECFLGLVPGWGGTQLLAPLIGADRAVTVLLENPLNQNRTLRAGQAFDLGIADAMFEPADFLERSLAWAAEVLAGRVCPERPSVDRGAGWQAALDRGRALADAKVHGAAPAPYRALRLLEVARTADREAGFAAEDEALADLLCGDELRAGLYAFDLVQKRARRPAGAPDGDLARPVGKVGVVGAGLMASQLALLFARRLQVPVVLTDLDRERLDRGVGSVHGEIGQLAERGRIDGDRANRWRGLVSGSLDLDAFADADLVIEAVFEEPAVKRRVFADCEAVVGDTCVLATNTSSLSVTQLAEGLAHPERVVGLHFFNPVAVLPLLEVARGAATDDATVATALALARTLGKSAVLVRDAPAFVVNRLLTRFLGAVTAAVDEGTPLEVADGALDPLGLPMSPFRLLALVGPAVALHVAETMHAAFPDRFPVSENLRRLVAADKPAVYRPAPGGGEEIDPEVAAVFEPAGEGRPRTAEQVRDAALAGLAEEIRLMLDDEVVAGPQDVDLCLLLGAGWPFHLGGITPYLDRTGVAERVTGQRFLPPGVASLPAPDGG